MSTTKEVSQTTTLYTTGHIRTVMLITKID